MAPLHLTLGWTYTTDQRCNKSIADCLNLSESFCGCEQHVFRFPHLTADVSGAQRTRGWNVAAHRTCVWLVWKWLAASAVDRCARVCRCTYVSVCLDGVFRVVNQRRGWGECQSVRPAPVKSPRVLSLSVLTPLNLSLSSLTLTHSTSIDTRYPAALQRPEENPLQWLSVWGEPAEKKGLYNAPTHTTRGEQIYRIVWFFFSWHSCVDKGEEKYSGNDTSSNQIHLSALWRKTQHPHMHQFVN